MVVKCLVKFIANFHPYLTQGFSKGDLISEDGSCVNRDSHIWKVICQFAVTIVNDSSQVVAVKLLVC